MKIVTKALKWAKRSFLSFFYTPSIIKEILDSDEFSQALFLCAQEDKTPEQQAQRIVGEADEFRRAVSGDGDPKEEAVDCLLDSMSLVEQQFRSKPEELQDMLRRKLLKYESQLTARGKI